MTVGNQIDGGDKVAHEHVGCPLPYKTAHPNARLYADISGALAKNGHRGGNLIDAHQLLIHIDPRIGKIMHRIALTGRGGECKGVYLQEGRYLLIGIDDLTGAEC